VINASAMQERMVEHWKNIMEKGNPTNKSVELRQKFEGQKTEDVIDGLFANWKLSNPNELHKNYV